MLEFLKKIFSPASVPDYQLLMQKGASIVDVRTKEEFAGGHIRNSINIPLQVLEKNLSKLPKDKPVITCCASGMRSASAKRIFIAKGYTEVFNGGSWIHLQKKI
ncbi:MAG: rhodanese-like domain-containing protein [Chitinophagales bacterium]